jgi:hypothetical protein
MKEIAAMKIKREATFIFLYVFIFAYYLLNKLRIKDLFLINFFIILFFININNYF